MNGPTASSETATWSLQTTLDLIRTIVQVVVVAVGAVWGYYRFVRSRTFKLRLEPTISGAVRNENQSTYVKVSCKLKNIGQCKADVSQEGSAVTILSHIPKVMKDADVIVWQHLKTLPVFEKHALLEPGETVNDEALVAVPAAVGQTFRLELRLVSNHIEWNAVSIVDPEQPETKKRSFHMADEEFYLAQEQKAEDTGTTKRIQNDKDRFERQKQEDKQQTQRIEQEKNKQPLKKNE